ncbi:(2Fe-2S)-binding protein [Candidatus Stoquefichus massiliensis]|uniref:(2Fe-2S)-binding protein n=1 Tax=Candidatus Stoquefichus massiliensis TaxID=1470350 RepID=UPI000484F7FF|nr:2Fe-2S iron-sulfur cluster-binding protein [Candidatus Stoquefichus massiliensis]
MNVKINLNGKDIEALIEPDMLLIDFLRSQGCFSVKRGCDTSNCGLCTVLADEKPILSCSVLAARMNGHCIVTLEGLQKEAQGLAEFIADQGAEQCGFCNPGMMMNAIALLKENAHPSDEEILDYLAGNLCRCSGYEGQLRGMKAYIAYLEQGKENS